jgi:hypothetical protein
VDVVSRGASATTMVGPTRPVPPDQPQAPSAPPPVRVVVAPGANSGQ